MASTITPSRGRSPSPRGTNYVGTGHVDPAYNGLSHDLTRGFKRENFWVMETQPGAVNWSPLNNFLNRGEARAMAWQAIGHGADDVNYWQWRSALTGKRKFTACWSDQMARLCPFMMKRLKRHTSLAQVENSFRGTQPAFASCSALLLRQSLGHSVSKHTERYDDIALLKSYYRALRQISQSIDVDQCVRAARRLQARRRAGT